MTSSESKIPGTGSFKCLLTSRPEVDSLLEGVTLANFTPAKEATLYQSSNASFILERIKITELCVGQRLRGRVHSVDRTGVTLDLGLPFFPFIPKADLNKVSVTLEAILEVEVTQVNRASNVVLLKAVSNLAMCGDELLGCLPSISQKMTCSLCAVQFSNRDEQVSHYKLDWHRYNLKQRIFGKLSVSEAIFSEMVEGISSLSGSESDDGLVTNESSESSSDTNSPKRKIPLPNSVLRTRHRSASVTSTDTDGESESASFANHARVQAKIFLRNGIGNILSFYRCLLHNKDKIPESAELLMSLVRSLPERTNWAIILVGGGHFAAAVFNGCEVISHKTLHRYTVRAKQGGGQSSRDGRGNQPKSAGASLRRHNEASIIKDIQGCLESWSKALSECHAVFYRAPSFNRVALFGNKNPPFSKDDPRLRNIPFPTRRATFREIQRVHTFLSTLECHGPESQFEVDISNSNRSPTKKAKPKYLSIEIPTRDEIDSLNCQPLLKDIERQIGTCSEEAAEFEDTEFIMTEETMLTSELQVMSVCVKGQVRRKKRRPKGTKRQQDPGTPIGEENERYQLKNALYIACSSGNKDKIEEFLGKLINLGSKPNETSFMPGFELTVPETRSNLVTNVDHNLKVFPSPTDSEVDFPGGVLRFSVAAPAINSSKEEDTPQTEDQILNEILNEPLGNFGGTLLHVAAKEGHKDVVRILLGLGADPTVKNKHGHTPYVLAGDKETRKEFRFFWGANPERYDYARSQIPCPLTEDTEQSQLLKANEKRREKKRVQRDKAKDRKAIEEAVKKDEAEKMRFLALSDREKRALAAEKRILKSDARTTVMLSRCFECGVDISGQIPFEYNQNRFCATKCVQIHRKKNASLS